MEVWLTGAPPAPAKHGTLGALQQPPRPCELQVHPYPPRRQQFSLGVFLCLAAVYTHNEKVHYGRMRSRSHRTSLGPKWPCFAHWILTWGVGAFVSVFASQSSRNCKRNEDVTVSAARKWGGPSRQPRQNFMAPSLLVRCRLIVLVRCRLIVLAARNRLAGWTNAVAEAPQALNPRPVGVVAAARVHAHAKAIATSLHRRRGNSRNGVF